MRAALPFFVTSVLALAYVLSRLQRWRWPRNVGVSAVLVLCLLSVHYDWAYGNGMNDTDPLVTARQWIEQHVGPATEVGVLQASASLRLWRVGDGEVLTSPPALTDRETHAPPRWLLATETTESQIDQLLERGFKLQRVFRTRPHTSFGVIDHRRWPNDWEYPFRTVWVLSTR